MAAQVPFELLVRAEALLTQAVVAGALPVDQRIKAATIAGELAYYVKESSKSFQLPVAVTA
jgi:hypothetical protein